MAKQKAMSVDELLRQMEKDTPVRYDFHGFTVAEAISVLEDNLPKLQAMGVKTVPVIHGKGTWRLAQGLQEYFKKSKWVNSFDTDFHTGTTKIWL